MLPHWLSLCAVVWLFPVAFMLHDLEEIAFVEHVLEKHRDRIRGLLPGRLVPLFEKRAHLRTDQFSVAVGVMLILVLLATLVGYRAIGQGRASPLFVASVFVFLLHGLLHTGQSLVLRAYTPGVVTSWLTVIPYSVYALYRLREAALWNAAMLWMAIPVAVVMVGGALVGHRAGMALRPHEGVRERDPLGVSGVDGLR